jgi:hypothetical protein
MEGDDAMNGEQQNGEERAAALEKELVAARAELQQERLTRQMENELRRASAIETEAATALLRERVRAAQEAGKEVDVRGLVAEMKKTTGVLFGGGAKTQVSPPSGATGAARSERTSVEAATQAAEAARASGDRRALLRYLRLRRG